MSVPVAEPPGNGRDSAQQRRVLVVEDEVTLRRIVARNLTSRGLEVREAGTAQEAVQAVSSNPPDLLLLDINLPDQTGWEVLRELKRRGNAVPTIIISAVRVNQNRLDEFHPLAYLPKPFPLDALLRLVLGNRQPEPGHPVDED